ncbi:MAG: hypothetical protein L6Q71_07055, partial [Planctomycetes bacterium]|nr:hypothetical protein [Planctomycetota bacterium]
RQIPPGVMVRLRYPSGHSLDAMSLGNGQFSSPFSTDPSQLIFTDVLAARFPILEMQELAPININTAPWEVLVAAVKGLRQGANWITQQDAEAFAAAVLHVRDDEFSGVRPPAYAELDMLLAPSESPYADQSQPLRWGGLRSDQELNILLGALVSAGEIGSYATSIIGQQQRYPYGGWPVVTAPFCYNTQGVMSIEGLATTFAGVGVDRGRARMKEIVEVGSDGPATWEWRDHRVINEERSRPQGNHFYNSFSRTDGLRRLDRVELPWLLDPTAMVANGPQTLTLGGQTFISPLSVDQNKAFYTASTVKQVNIANGGAGQTEVADMRSGSLSFWYKMPVGFIGNQDTYVFDNGEGQYTDRISLLWWGGGRRAGRLALKPPGLTLRIKDRTLEQAFTAAHINVDPAKFREGNWYHFNVGWNGNEPGQMNVFIDGVSERGAGATETDHVFLDSQGAWVARTSKLMSDVPPELGNIGLGGSATDSINIDPNDVAAFPEPGVIRIGDEAISYTTKTGNGFTGLGRGARGTRAPQTGETPYPAGAKVTAFGYSVAVRNDSQSTHLPAGGALLADPLEGNGFYRVIGGDGTADAGYYAAEVIGPQVGFTNTTNFLPLDSMTGIPECGVMYVAGLCWKSYAQDPAGSGKLIPDHDGDGTPEFTSNGAVMTQGNYFDAEYILFTRAAGGVNVVQRYDASFNLKAAQDHYHFMGAWNGVTPADPLSVSTGGTPANYWEISGTVCLLVSARRNVDGAYHDPQAHSARQCRIQIDTEWLQYNRLISYGGYYLFVYTFGNQAFLGGKAVDRAQWHAQGLPVPGIDGFRELDANQNAVTRSVGTEIMPVFNIRGNRAGASDVVTVVAAPNNDKVERSIVRVETHGPYQNSNGNVISGHQYLGLHTNVLRDYPANSSELLRFPADPLPRGTPTRLRFGGMCYADAALGNAAATEVDELKFDGWPDGTFKVLVDIASTEKTGIVVRPTNGNLPESGLIKIGDELIMYRETTGTTADEFLEQPANSGWWVQQTSNAVQLGKLSRGVLGTKTVAHARNILGMLVKNQPVYYTQGGIAADDHDISLTGHMAGVPTFGFMRAERSSASSTVSEFFGFNSSANTGNNTYRVTTGTYHPQNWGALFRGSYGTTPQAWDSSAVITQMPVRQPDFCPRWLRATKGQLSLSPEVSYLQGSQAFHNATINQLRWRMDARPQIELANYMGAKLFVRFDGAPDWDAVPDAAGPLYVFDFDWGRAQQIDDGGVKVYEQTIDFGSLLNRAVDQIEWRLVYYFQNNAYDADYWKGTLWFKGLLLDLDTETRILSHEEER